MNQIRRSEYAKLRLVALDRSDCTHIHCVAIDLVHAVDTDKVSHSEALAQWARRN